MNRPKNVQHGGVLGVSVPTDEVNPSDVANLGSMFISEPIMLR